MSLLDSCAYCKHAAADHNTTRHPVREGVIHCGTCPDGWCESPEETAIVIPAHTLRSMHGSLEFSFSVKLEGIEARPQPYVRRGSAARYLPEHLHFVLTAESTDPAKLPRYKDLMCASASLAGPKLKKDETPGMVRAHEAFYGGTASPAMPPWVREIIEKYAMEVREQAVTP
jgi:hypothetical protein